MSWKFFMLAARVTGAQLVIGAAMLIDLLLPDLTVLSSIRSWCFRLVAGIGRGTRIRKGQYFSGPWKVTIGENCFINRGNLFDCGARIIIGDNCSIGYRNAFITTSHLEKAALSTESYVTFLSDPIRIGENVWITTNCTILPGSVIDDNVIVAAGSVVRGRLEANGVYAGVPARRIKETSGIVPKRV